MDDLREQTEGNELFCKETARAYSVRLRSLTPYNWALVIGAAVLSTVAGVGIFADLDFFPKESAAILALISGVFTVIHTKANCDYHQAECKKLKGNFERLAWEYRNLKSIADTKERRRKLQSLNDRCGLLLENAEAQPSPSNIARAKRLVRREAQQT